MIKRRFIFYFLAPLLVWSGYAFQGNQPREQEYNLKAAFLYRFLDYVDLNGGNNMEPLHVAILGESEIYEPLTEISRTKKAGTRVITVRQVNSVTEIGNSQIIFVSRNYKFPIDVVTNRLSDRPALIVSEQKGELEKGSHINFIVAENKLKFEVNLGTASRAGIRIGSQLLQHALVIKR